MKRVENRAEKAIRAGQKASRCATLQPAGLCDEILTRAEGRRAEAERQELLAPVGEIKRGAGEVFHLDPRDTETEESKLILFNTLEHPNMISVNASENRMEAALKAGVLEAAVDAAETASADNSLEKMLAHQMATAHHLAMKLAARGMKDNLIPVEAARLTNSAARMMQVYQEGLLALHKIRRGGKQVVVVQHVQVSEGGQAVIAGSMKNRGDES